MAYATRDGIRIHYEVKGEGTPLVLHHGLADALDGWRDAGWVAGLRDAHRLVLIDARGHGASDRPHAADAYGIAAHVRDVLAVLDALGIERAHFAGYSLGGVVGFGLAGSAPHRLRALVIGGARPYAESMAPFREIVAGGTEGLVRIVERALGRMPPSARSSPGSASSWPGRRGAAAPGDVTQGDVTQGDRFPGAQRIASQSRVQSAEEPTAGLHARSAGGRRCLCRARRSAAQRERPDTRWRHLAQLLSSSLGGPRARARKSLGRAGLACGSCGPTAA